MGGSIKPTISFEIFCESCNGRELWGLEQAVRALINCGKLRGDVDFNADLVAELFLLHADHIACPHSGETGTLTVRRAVPGDWEWDDVIRCEDCKKPIPEARLKALPGVTRCRDCQAELERH